MPDDGRQDCNLFLRWRILSTVARLADIEVPEELLARTRAGDGAAQAQLYVLLAPPLFALIRRVVGARAVAEDLFQDSMILVYERLDSFRGEAPLGAWVSRIAVSRCLMYLRSPWQRVRLGLGAEDPQEPESLLPSTPPLLPETLDLERALASLSVTARTVVWLFEVEGWSHEEIARAFGRTTGFSKSQLSRAHQRLRGWFKSREDSATCAPTT